METLPLFPPASEPTSSRRASPASRFPRPEDDGARRTTARSGLACSRLSPASGPLGRCLRTLLASPLWRSPAGPLAWSAKPLADSTTVIYTVRYTHDKTACISERSVAISKTKVSRSSRSLFRLALSARRTSASASGSSPGTPAAATEARSAAFKSARPAPRERAALFPTPLASCANGPQTSRNRGGLKLQQAVSLFPTPRASPGENRQTKPSPSQRAGRRGRSLAAVACGSPPPGRGHPAGAGLNPDWVELLMGFPPGWTEVTAAPEPGSGTATGSGASRASPPPSPTVPAA